MPSRCLEDEVKFKIWWPQTSHGSFVGTLKPREAAANGSHRMSHAQPRSEWSAPQSMWCWLRSLIAEASFTENSSLMAEASLAQSSCKSWRISENPWGGNAYWCGGHSNGVCWWIMLRPTPPGLRRTGSMTDTFRSSHMLGTRLTSPHWTTGFLPESRRLSMAYVSIQHRNSWMQWTMPSGWLEPRNLPRHLTDLSQGSTSVLQNVAPTLSMNEYLQNWFLLTFLCLTHTSHSPGHFPSGKSHRDVLTFVPQRVPKILIWAWHIDSYWLW